MSFAARADYHILDIAFAEIHRRRELNRPLPPVQSHVAHLKKPRPDLANGRIRRIGDDRRDRDRLRTGQIRKAQHGKNDPRWNGGAMKQNQAANFLNEHFAGNQRKIR